MRICEDKGTNGWYTPCPLQYGHKGDHQHPPTPNKPITAAPALPDVAEGGKWPECQRYESATGEIFNVRLVNKPENKIVYTRSDVDLNGIFTVTLSEWLADLGEQRGAIDEALNELKLLALDKDYRADSFTLQPLRNALLGAGEQRGDTPADKVRAVWEKVTRHKPQEAQPLPAESSRDELMEEIARLNRVCKVQYRLERTLRKERDEAEAELSRLTSTDKWKHHLAKRMFDECGIVKAEDFISRFQSGEHDVPSPWQASKEEQGGWIKVNRSTIPPNDDEKQWQMFVVGFGGGWTEQVVGVRDEDAWKDCCGREIEQYGSRVTFYGPLPAPPDSRED